MKQEHLWIIGDDFSFFNFDCSKKFLLSKMFKGIGSYLSFLCVGFPIDGIVFRHFKSKLLQAELKCLKTKPSMGKSMHKKDK